jgi:monovalent cation/hydrogen antiporter
MQEYFLEYMLLILLIIALVMVANKLKVAYPIVLVIGGVALSFVEIFSDISIDPDLIFFIFLPPLLYQASWQISWKDFWKYRRVIASFAFPIVIITSCVVAFASNTLIPGFTLALGFLLGGIVSPPDAISSTTIMRQVDAPKTLVTVAEGESLLNDASALVVFRFALAAIVTGKFDLGHAVGDFFLVIILGTAIGLAIGFIFYAIHRWLPTTPSIDIVLTIVGPYCMYYAAERFHYSGVLAVVAGGLFLSSQRLSMLSSEARVQGVNVWSTLSFMMNGVIFMLIGLQLPLLISELKDISLGQAIWYGVVISFVLIITRMLCTLGAAAFTRFIGQYIEVAERNVDWRVPVVFGWSGMRGVVSLAAALSIPVVMNGSQPFPYRNLILIITFIVILITLVGQGLTLPWLIRKMKFKDQGAQANEQQQELFIRKSLAQGSINFLNKMRRSQTGPNAQLDLLTQKLSSELKLFEQDIEDFNKMSRDGLADYQETYLKLLEEQRLILLDINGKDGFNEELIRKYLAVVDMEETKLREMMMGRGESS